jgi:hypothetical protein
MKGFRDFIKLQEQNVPGYHLDGPGGSFIQRGNAFLNSNNPRTLERTPLMPDTFLHIPEQIPQTKRSGKIRFIERNKNPIRVQLSDGTWLYFTLDEFNRIKEEPEVGKTMTVIFQCRPDAKTSSKIDRIEVK